MMVPPLLQKNRGTCLRRRLCDDDVNDDDSNAKKDRKKNPPFERRTTMTSEASVVTSFVVKEREFCVSARTPFNGEVMRRFTILPNKIPLFFFLVSTATSSSSGSFFFFYEHTPRVFNKMYHTNHRLYISGPFVLINTKVKEKKARRRRRKRATS